MEKFMTHIGETEGHIRDGLNTMIARHKINPPRAIIRFETIALPPDFSLELWDQNRRRRESNQINDDQFGVFVAQFQQKARDIDFRRNALLTQIRNALEYNTELATDPYRPDNGAPIMPRRMFGPMTPMAPNAAPSPQKAGAGQGVRASTPPPGIQPLGR
jgi:hypothetical protein